MCYRNSVVTIIDDLTVSNSLIYRSAVDMNNKVLPCTYIDTAHKHRHRAGTPIRDNGHTFACFLCSLDHIDSQFVDRVATGSGLEYTLQ